MNERTSARRIYRVRIATETSKKIRTSNAVERLHEEIKRRTRVARLFAIEASLLRLVSTIEIKISEDGIARKEYLNMENRERKPLR